MLVIAFGVEVGGTAATAAVVAMPVREKAFFLLGAVCFLAGSSRAARERIFALCLFCTTARRIAGHTTETQHPSDTPLVRHIP